MKAYVVSYTRSVGGPIEGWGVIYPNREARWYQTEAEAIRAAHVYNIGGAPE